MRTSFYLSLLGLLCIVSITGCSSTTAPGDTNNNSNSTTLSGTVWERDAYYSSDPFLTTFIDEILPPYTSFNTGGTVSQRSSLSGSVTNGSWTQSGNTLTITLPSGATNRFMIVSNSGVIMHLQSVDTSYTSTGIELDTAHFILSNQTPPKVTDATVAGKTFTSTVTVMGYSNISSTANNKTTYNADHTYHTEYPSGSTKSGTWEINADSAKIIMDKGKSNASSFMIMAATDNLLSLKGRISGQWTEVISRIDTSALTNTEKLLSSGTWTVQSVQMESGSTTAADAARHQFNLQSNGTSEYAGVWYLRDNEKHLVLDGGSSDDNFEILEVTPTSLKLRQGVISAVDYTGASVIITASR